MFAALMSPIIAGIVAVSGGHAPANHYTVRPGDTLSAIAQHELGSAKMWPKLWWVNRRQVSNPDVISAGEHLVIPSWDRTWPYQRKAALAAIPHVTVTANTAQTASSSPPAATASVASPAVAASGFEACVIARESGGNPQAYNPSSGAGGLYQFLLSTWMGTPEGASYPGGAQTAPVSVQEAAFAYVYARDGPADWAPYDGC